MKTTAVIHAHYNYYEKKFEFRAACSDMSKYGFGVVIAEIEVEFPEPKHADMIARTVEIYRAKQREIRSESEQQCTELQTKIDELQCLEFKP